MNILPDAYDNLFLTFLFVYARVAAAVFTMPVIGSRTISRTIRAGVAFWIAIVIMSPMLGLNGETIANDLGAKIGDYNGVLAFVIAIVAEMAIGFAFGFIGQVFIQTIGISGEIIGQQGGFSAASVLDPITGQDIFLMNQVMNLLATLIFIVIGGPEMVFQILYDSFRVLHPGEGFALASFGEASYHTLIYDGERSQALGAIMYTMGVQLAAPMIGSMILISVAEAFLARTVPQLNIMAVGFAIRISMALLILFAAMQFIVVKLTDYLQQYMVYAQAMLRNIMAF